MAIPCFRYDFQIEFAFTALGAPQFQLRMRNWNDVMCLKGVSIDYLMASNFKILFSERKFGIIFQDRSLKRWAYCRNLQPKRLLVGLILQFLRFFTWLAPAQEQWCPERLAW